MAEDKTDDQTTKKTEQPREYSVSSGIAPTYVRDIRNWSGFTWIRNKLSEQKPKVDQVNTIVIIGIITSALVGFGAGWLGANQNRNSDNILTSSSQKQVVTSESQLINSIAKTVGPSVVSVNVVSTTTSSSNYFGFGGGQPQSARSAGTGIILNPSGIIITNRHVVPAGTTSVSVTLADGTELKDVSVIGRTNASSSLDIAFLKINNAKGKTLIPARIGNSSKVQVGDAVVTIGNALGQFQNTVTSGIISGYGRSVQTTSTDGTQASENLDDLFQTDAAINEGNSGGPLVNMSGEVIGINTAIAGNAQSIGFAIPINDVTGLIKQAQNNGSIQQPYIGVYYIPLTGDVAQQYNLSVSRGAWIPSTNVIGQNPIVPGGPAEKAGLKPGDIITKVDNTTIDQTSSITSIIGKYQVGQTINLTVIRDGKTIQVNVILGSEPSN